ncbi:alpha-galactosidase, partial [Paenibacillus sepulcri]|nr:alpha-galactosidase [Paenibacillus sepulcri]
MTIRFDEEHQLFHLQTPSMSYIFQALKGYPTQLYWGRKIKQAHPGRLLERVERASFSSNPIREDRTISLDTLPHEYPGYGTSDTRTPAYEVLLSSGASATELHYVTHRIEAGKPKLENLPAVYAENDQEAQTLIVELADELAGLKVELSYTVFEKFDAIIRSSRIMNISSEAISLQRALSASVDLPHDRYDMLQLSGAWTRERYIHR